MCRSFSCAAVFYFVVWGVMVYFLNKWSAEQDHSATRASSARLQNLSGPGLVLFGLTVTFAGVDWLMSLEPHWFSTIYGMLVMAGWGLSALAFTILVLGALSGREPMAGVYAPAHFQDLGKLLLAFVMVYAYFSFSQFLIIWAGNLPEEIPWYLRRTRGGWDVIGIILVVIHFALPFIMLLSRDLKRNARRLVWVAALVILARMVDMVYLVAPAFHHEGQAPHVNPWDFLGNVRGHGRTRRHLARVLSRATEAPSAAPAPRSRCGKRLQRDHASLNRRRRDGTRLIAFESRASMGWRLGG